MPPKGRPLRARTDPAVENRKRGLDLIRRHPLFAPLAYEVIWSDGQDDDRCPPGGWAVVTSLRVRPPAPARPRGEPEERASPRRTACSASGSTTWRRTTWRLAGAPECPRRNSGARDPARNLAAA